MKPKICLHKINSTCFTLYDMMEMHGHFDACCMPSLSLLLKGLSPVRLNTCGRKVSWPIGPGGFSEISQIPLDSSLNLQLVPPCMPSQSVSFLVFTHGALSFSQARQQGNDCPNLRISGKSISISFYHHADQKANQMIYPEKERKTHFHINGKIC